MNERPIVWSVAGSDSGGGAGIQADLRAFDAFGVHGCTAVAAITAQNSVAVQRVEAVTPDLLEAQLAALAEDLPPLAIKSGLLGSADNVRVLARWVRRMGVPLVVDPVWRASTGAAMAGDDLRAALHEELIPLATVLTPNRAEAAWLLGRDMAPEEAARALRRLGATAAVVTGGDDEGDDSSDMLDAPQAVGQLSSPRVATPHHHGTGCVFASSIAAALAIGFCEADAVVLAKMATSHALHHASAAGQGAGPVRPQRGFARRGELLPALWRPRDARTSRTFAAMDGPIGLYPVVDDAAWVERVAAAGVTTVQLRIKEGAAAALDAQVGAAVAAAGQFGVRLFINDHWRLALKHRAWGVHLGQQDLDDADLDAIAAAGLRLGVSSHAPWEVARAAALRPSYIACGPIHPTPTKDMPWTPQGAHNLAYWCGTLSVPVVAIGGLDVPRASEAARCGADGIAVLRGIVQSVEPLETMRAYVEAIEAAAKQPSQERPDLPRPTLSRGTPSPSPAWARPSPGKDGGPPDAAPSPRPSPASGRGRNTGA
jgi:hydroxymethylpyrimidine kinase/phosphomethylpyrimidine kinase/thiamine-phosphate diphosphorylase